MRSISISRQVVRQEENRRWEQDNAPGSASRRARREEGHYSSPPTLAALRRSELRRLFVSRWGPTLPDDDSGRDDVRLFADHCGMNGQFILRDFCRSFAPWMSVDEMDEIFEQRRVVTWSADDLGDKLRLRDEERTKLKITTIGAFDCKKSARKRRRKHKDQERQKKRRAEAGARPHAKSLSRMKPWDSAGMSRSKWYRLPPEERPYPEAA